jgi:hypothetical protein
MFIKTKKIVTLFALAFCLLSNLSVAAQTDKTRLCEPNCPIVSDIQNLETRPKPSKPNQASNDLCGGPCPIMEDRFINEKTDNQIVTNDIVLKIAQFVTFIVISLSVILIPTSLIAIIVCLITKSKKLKWALIIFCSCIIASVITIIGYTIISSIIATQNGQIGFGR